MHMRSILRLYGACGREDSWHAELHELAIRRVMACLEDPWHAELHELSILHVLVNTIAATLLSSIQPYLVGERHVKRQVKYLRRERGATA